MAHPQSTYNTANGNSTTDYTFSFPYLKESEIKVSCAGVDKAVGTSSSGIWYLLNATTVRFNTAPEAASSPVRIYRDTGTDNLKANFYPGSAIRSGDLNDNFTQNLYVTQEADYSSADAADYAKRFCIDGDGTSESGIESHPDLAQRPTKPKGVPYSVTKSEEAKTAADTAKLATDRIVATTSDGGNTWTLKGGNTNASTDPKGVKYAVDQAEDAVSVATAADNIADGAKIDADNAKMATDRLVATTSNGGTTWTLTGNNTNASTDPKGVGWAVTKSEEAVVDATAALANSRKSGGSGGWTSAISVADTASSTATTASNTATTAKTATDTYVHDGSGLKGDGIGGNPQGVAYAVAKATEAINSVAGAGIYTVVANLAALPAISSSNDGDFFQISDTTGITRSSGTFNPTTFAVAAGVNFPSNFTGDDELTIKVKINNTSGKYEVQEYYSNDPETRYRKKVVIESKKTISEDYRVGGPTNESNGLIVGPCTIAATYTVTIPADTRLVVL